MLRDLSTLLTELQQSLLPFSAGVDGEIRLHDAELVLPLDLRVVLADGGAQLLADVPRSFAEGHWRIEASRLSLRLVATEAMP